MFVFFITMSRVPAFSPIAFALALVKTPEKLFSMDFSKRRGGGGSYPNSNVLWYFFIHVWEFLKGGRGLTPSPHVLRNFLA